MTVTNFEDLGKLKAGSRTPINIYKCTSETINFTSYIESNNNTTTTETPSHGHNSQPDRKYYSYLNKIFTNNSSLSINSVGSSSTSSIMSGSSVDNSSDYDTSDADVRYMKSLCKKLLSKQQALNTSATRLCATSKVNKLLTILFDYEDATESFQVKQGDNVELLETIMDDADVDGQYKYVVRKSLDGMIGSIPIDYTIDLNDIKQMVRFNMKKHHVKLTKL
jgi:hypothetical protein